jgi:hypothetical protein
MSEKTVGDVLSQFYLDEHENWTEYRQNRCTSEEARKHEKYLEENAEQEIRTLLNGRIKETIEEFVVRTKKVFIKQGGNDLWIDRIHEVIEQIADEMMGEEK